MRYSPSAAASLSPLPGPCTSRVLQMPSPGVLTTRPSAASLALGPHRQGGRGVLRTAVPRQRGPRRPCHQAGGRQRRGRTRGARRMARSVLRTTAAPTCGVECLTDRVRELWWQADCRLAVGSTHPTLWTGWPRARARSVHKTTPHHQPAIQQKRSLPDPRHPTHPTS